MINNMENIRKNTLHMSLIKLMRAHRRKTEVEFEKIGITRGQPKILDFLVENDGCIQRELADSCNIEPATVTSILSSMEKAELIYRTPNPDDRRVLNVFLTEKGKAAQKQVEKIFLTIDDECFEGFSDEEKVQTLDILERLYKNLTTVQKEREKGND